MDKTTIRVELPREEAAAFHAACQIDGGVSFVLRQFIRERTGSVPAAPRRAAADQVLVRLADEERIALLRASDARGDTPAGYLRRLARAHLLGKPQWTGDVLAMLRDVFRELRRIADATDEETPAAVSRAVREVGAAVSGELAYWGGEELARGVQARDAEIVRAARARVRDAKRRRV